MPFDGIDGFDNHPIAKLGAVERMLATEQQWCKGRLRDAHGRHCLVGAIEAVGGRQVLQKPILHAAREVSGKRYWRIEFFNDDPRTTHEDVLQVSLDHYLNLGSWFAGTPDDLVAHLKGFEERYPGMQHVNLSPPLTTPKDKMVEQYRMVGELVMPHFRSRPAVQAAAK